MNIVIHTTEKLMISLNASSHFVWKYPIFWIENLTYSNIKAKCFERIIYELELYYALYEK